jgi:hypothetical protein
VAGEKMERRALRHAPPVGARLREFADLMPNFHLIK